MQPIPDNIESVLNAMQMVALRDIEQRGWKLYFVRREGLAVPMPVIRSDDGKRIGIIEQGGNINTTPDIKIRINPERRVLS